MSFALLNRGRFPGRHLAPSFAKDLDTGPGRGGEAEIRIRRSARLPPFGNLLPITSTSFYLVLYGVYRPRVLHTHTHTCTYMCRFHASARPFPSTFETHLIEIERGRSSAEREKTRVGMRELARVGGRFSNRIDRHLYDRNYLKCSSCARSRAGRLI